MSAYASDTNFRYKNAITEDFIAIVNSVTGEDYQWFFDEWIYAPNHPVYSNLYEIDDLGNGTWTVTLQVEQTQTSTVFFRMPVEVGISFSDGSDTLVTVWNDSNPQSFVFTFDKSPVNLTFDPDQEIVLKEAVTVVSLNEGGPEPVFELRQNEPNPFTGTTALTYSVGQPSQVRIQVMNAGGRVVLTPVSRFHSPGVYRYLLSDDTLTPGVYVFRMDAGTFSQSRKMVISE